MARPRASGGSTPACTPSAPWPPALSSPPPDGLACLAPMCSLEAMARPRASGGSALARTSSAPRQLALSSPPLQLRPGASAPAWLSFGRWSLCMMNGDGGSYYRWWCYRLCTEVRGNRDHGTG